MTPDDHSDATRRTWLANERTWLAWLRTGLTATALALAAGRFLPELAGTRTRWPYASLGVGYAVLGVALVLYGLTRRREVDAAIHRGQYAAPNDRILTALVVLATALGVGTIVVVIVS